MRHYLFYDAFSGEHFLVGADTLDDAEYIAEGLEHDLADEYGEAQVEYLQEMSEWEAENSGFDEY